MATKCFNYYFYSKNCKNMFELLTTCKEITLLERKQALCINGGCCGSDEGDPEEDSSGNTTNNNTSSTQGS